MPSWLLIMFLVIVEPDSKEIKDIVVTTMSTGSEAECKYAGGLEEVRLRNDLNIDTSKHFSVNCVQLPEQKGK